MVRKYETHQDQARLMRQVVRVGYGKEVGCTTFLDRPNSITGSLSIYDCTAGSTKIQVTKGTHGVCNRFPVSEWICALGQVLDKLMCTRADGQETLWAV